MSIIDNINKAFDHRVRLGIMSVLVVNEYADFRKLKELLDVTDGNLASHARALEQAGYITVQKQFIGRKPNTRYMATTQGKNAFQDHIDALEALIRKNT
ncbi:winged helix-turn-helix domain-containing protein [Sinomicrobium soli]|uniref:winged helix-turn-helix domain-containing protein n=1 Tax=Sinomicrobium sp. N-1-3-6 TaxID=2219864 RepID=UPI000DCCD6F3|nr:transcriptional regulator [Sinomicrobium sp. N-1-3-6]RAV29835.1 transcriptional regulator [Sinomicrobium sp. N-1-3-6]